MKGDGRQIQIIGVPMDHGAGRRGVGMGPSAIRVAGLGPGLRELGFDVIDHGDVGVPSPEARDSGDPAAKYLDLVYHVCNRLRIRVVRSLAAGGVPVVLGGDHSIAIGTVSGVAEHFREADAKIGMIWVDAHADMNTPDSTLTGNIHGMPVATLLGMGADKLTKLGGFSPKLDCRNLCLIGIRNLDEKEKELVRQSGVQAYTMRDIDERGMPAVAKDAIDRASDGTSGFHVSFDLDGMDPAEAPGVGTAVKGGLSWREGNLLMEMIADSGKMVSLELTELNPVLDVRNQTGEVAVDLILSAFGKSII
ncbi:MAG: arginase [Planctomycetota bacterium]|jgi:arginase|nr:arginase [Planctomycetota bacterium]